MSQEVKGLRPGMWCNPGSHDLWKAMFDISRHKGLLGDIADQVREFKDFPLIGYAYGSPTGQVAPVQKGCIGQAPWQRANELPVHEFIARMYEQAEINKNKELAEDVQVIAEQMTPEVGRVRMFEPNDHEKRIKALEERVSKLEEGKKGVYKLDGTSILGDSYCISFDPKASPKNIPFSVALEYLKIGREVRRTSWREPTERVQPRGVKGQGGLTCVYKASLVHGSFEPTLSDLLATDWEVLPE